MKRLQATFLILGATVTVFCWARNVQAQTVRGPDLQATAVKLVRQCADIKRGELVLITGQPRDVDLLELVSIKVQKMGAFPLVSVQSEKMSRLRFDEVPAKFDSETNQLQLKLAGIITAHISVSGSEDPTLWSDVDPERVIAFESAYRPIMETVLKRNVKQVNLGNGLYPTEATARLHGLTRQQLETLFWNGVNTDYTRLQKTGQTVRSVLASGREVHITNPNGTDFKFRIEGRPVLVSDGIISSDDVALGGAALQVWLPAGEVFLAPVPQTAEGKVVVDRHLFQGKEIRGLELTFAAGKLTNMTAKSGLEPLKTFYEAAGKGKDIFAFVDVGINEDVQIPAGSKLLTWMAAGMVTIGTGNNTWAGGTNDCPFGISGFLPGSTLTVDGKTLVKNGALEH